jgi:hypothetical protein
MSQAGSTESSCSAACNVEYNVPECYQSCQEEYNCGEACQDGYDEDCALCQASYTACTNTCNTDSSELQSCLSSCTGTFDSAATTCYYDYCI